MLGLALCCLPQLVSAAQGVPVPEVNALPVGMFDAKGAILATLGAKLAGGFMGWCLSVIVLREHYARLRAARPFKIRFK